MTQGTEFKGPIVEGAYYIDADGEVLGPARAYEREPGYYGLSGIFFWRDGSHSTNQRARLTRRVYIVHADPLDIVVELRELQLNAHVDAHSEFGGRTDEAREEAFSEAADLVAKALEVKP